MTAHAPAHPSTARRASGVKPLTAGTPPSSRGRKAHNCSPSGGTGGVSPGRAEAHAEDARRVDTPVGPQLSPPRHRTQPPRLCRSQPRIHLSSEPPFLSRPALVRRTNRPQPTHTCFRRANIPGDRELHCVTLISSSSLPCHRGQASEHARPRGSLGCSAPFFTVVNRPVPASHPRGVVFDVVLFAMGFSRPARRA